MSYSREALSAQVIEFADAPAYLPHSLWVCTQCATYPPLARSGPSVMAGLDLSFFVIVEHVRRMTALRKGVILPTYQNERISCRY